MHTRLSAYGAASSRPAPVNRMMSGFAHHFRDGIDINLGVGYVNERTIPVDLFREALDRVAADPLRYRQAFNYGGPAGSPNLVRSLRRLVGAPESHRLIIGACGATSMLDALASVLEPGVVVTSDPMYYIYTEALERRGFELLTVPEDSEGIELAALDRKLATLGEKRIAFFYAVTVNNPSCTILSNRRRRELYERAVQYQAPILYDLAYEQLLHDPGVEPFRSVLAEDPLGIVYETGTLSKVFAPALRIGYFLGPRGPLMDALVQRTSDAGFSAPLFVQEMAGYLIEHHLEEQLSAVNAGYREKAVAVKQAMTELLGDAIEDCRGGSAGFYFYVTLTNVETHEGSAFFRRLTEAGGTRVFYIPGEHCVNPRGELAPAGRRQMRLSYAYEDTPRIIEGLRIMRAAADALTR